MKLHNYLSDNALSVEAFAGIIGTTPQSVYRWMRGERFPRPRMMKAIMQATGGKVTYADFQEPQAAPSKRKSARFRQSVAA